MLKGQIHGTSARTLQQARGTAGQRGQRSARHKFRCGFDGAQERAVQGTDQLSSKARKPVLDASGRTAEHSSRPTEPGAHSVSRQQQCAQRAACGGTRKGAPEAADAVAGQDGLPGQRSCGPTGHHSPHC